jgi:hypothetical protein
VNLWKGLAMKRKSIVLTLLAAGLLAAVTSAAFGVYLKHFPWF